LFPSGAPWLCFASEFTFDQGKLFLAMKKAWVDERGLLGVGHEAEIEKEGAEDDSEHGHDCVWVILFCGLELLALSEVVAVTTLQEEVAFFGVGFFCPAAGIVDGDLALTDDLECISLHNDGSAFVDA